MLMTEHYKLICKCCDVVEIRENAIFYFDDGMGYAEVGDMSFSCHNLEEFHELVEMFGEDY